MREKLRSLTTAEVGPEEVAWVLRGESYCTILVSSPHGDGGVRLDSEGERLAMARWLREAAAFLELDDAEFLK